ncbi:hypothetical protein IMG5_153250 [Ichthyophthirius multifiliis]|uniref:Pre-mRNA-splicing factor SLU7 n=1 Tax=Ichthyophthirius multifiliis TaxID=5932 RepID=G0QYY3_ICHMU|nr:hypothetical protein IMG5_153250 [Ichthyophthirius multifiliis]EGR29554.1 hypothetical protein IMG5_153250 [Ichthyophthirius multifiliis]|eukprot:XP_004030790.1 hypothetical protein IMG5_153250 [Ichthyophthirius multifiliis]
MSTTQFVSRDEYKQQKALEEARKAGKIPAQLDEEGKEINPHMPQYITVAPWYLNQTQPSMKHQYFFKGQERDDDQQWYARGQKGFQSTKYRKGACENCGALTHTIKECCERPRKKGAKLTGQNIAADDIIMNLNFSYDAKRHNWNGYDPDEYMQKIKNMNLQKRYEKKNKNKNLKHLQMENMMTEQGNKMIVKAQLYKQQIRKRKHHQWI